MRTIIGVAMVLVVAGGIAVGVGGCYPAQPTTEPVQEEISERDREIFLTPGGIYTQADIEANGNTVPKIKYKDVDWPHDPIEKAGDRICPVTDNKADPRCTWVVNGQEYTFCCSPCLSKFVRKAKDPERNKSIKQPGEYVATEEMVTRTNEKKKDD